jgi:tRNA-splicing ligase RtcB
MKTKRVSDVEIRLTGTPVEASIYMADPLKPEPSALEEAESVTGLDGLERLSFTPDFHKGAGAPIGTVALFDRVYPRMVGNDIGCGIGFSTLPGLKDFEATKDIKDRLRHAFFEGGRDISIQSRADILAYGMGAADISSANVLSGRTSDFLPHGHHSHDDFLGDGRLSSLFADWCSNASVTDNTIGSIGGGNHFVEIQVVDEVVDRSVAHLLGLRKGMYCVMVHSGSLDLGHATGNRYTDLARATHVGRHPENGMFALYDEMAEAYMVAANNAANFATANRAVLAAMVGQTLDVQPQHVYDSPHNYIWKHRKGFLHRKGSCPARFQETVMVPGSMGTRSCIARGLGFEGALSSSAHGAGRVLNRNAARSAPDMLPAHLVTRLDPTLVRSDIAEEIRRSLSEEAPRAYKDVEEVIKTSAAAGILSVVAWMRPLLTIKG